MRSLTPTQRERKEAVQVKLAREEAKLLQVIEQFNATVQKQWSLLEASANSYNEAVSEANQLLAEVHSAQESFAAKRGESWAESDAGEDYQSWMDDWDLEIDEFELPDVPEEVDPPDSSAHEGLAGLPESP